MFKQSGIERKEMDIVTMMKKKMNQEIVKIEINQHPLGKLSLPPMKKIEAINILRMKGYL